MLLLHAALLLTELQHAADVLRGVRIIAVMIGSSNFAMRPASGNFAGLSTSITSPSVVVTR